MLKLLHLSDIHLGIKLGFLGEKADSHRKRIWENLQSAINFAVDNNIDAVIATGDVFDTPYSSKEMVDRFMQLATKLEQNSIYLIVLPGNHDRLEAGSVWTEKYKNKFLKVVNDPQSEINEIILEDLQLVVLGRPTTTQKSKQSPLSGMHDRIKQLKENLDKSYRIIVMAHGSVSLAKEADNFPIHKQDIASLGVDYLALGDWHGLLDVSEGGQIAFYPGSLEFLSTEQENSGHMLLVEIEDKQKTKVTPYKISRLKTEVRELNLNQIDIQNLSKEIIDLADENLLLTIKLTGQVPIGNSIEVEELQDNLDSKFYNLKLVDKIEWTNQDMKKEYPENSIPREYIKMVNELTKKGEIEKEISGEVLRLGLQTMKKNQKND